MNSERLFRGFLGITAILGLFVILILLPYSGITGLVVFEQTDGIDFNFGTYDNTQWNGSALVLFNSINGNYTSQIIDSGQKSTWNNVSINSNDLSKEVILVPDVSSEVWSSIDKGITWNSVNSDYTGFGGGGSNSITVDDNRNFYILSAESVWKSEDFGVTWTLVDSDFNGGSAGRGIDISFVQGYLVIVSTTEEIWRSDNQGASFVEVNSSFNSGGRNARDLVGSGSDLFIVDRSADVWRSQDAGVTWTKVNDDYNGANSNNANSITADGNGDIYILHGQDIWRSDDLGVSWNLASDDFNSGDGNGGAFVYAGFDDSVYAGDNSEDIWRSDNQGAIFTKVSSNINGANGNLQDGISEIADTNLLYQFRNCSLPDCSDSNFVGPDGTSGSYYVGSEFGLNLRGRYLQYRITFESEVQDLSPYIQSIGINYDSLIRAPNISMSSPAQGQVFGFNESLDLEYSISLSESSLDSCWYNVVSVGGGYGSGNISLPGCSNTTFSVPGEGDYNITLYANESDLGLVGVKSNLFSVSIQPPAITLVSPVNEYLNYTENITFVYNASDPDLVYCELWGDFIGGFEFNQTAIGVVSGDNSNFSLPHLGEGAYNWSVYCEDSLSQAAFSSNESFFVDITDPEVNITEPIETHTSLTGIPLLFEIIDASPVSCSYNVTFASSGNIFIDNTEIPNCSDTSFSVDTESNYVLSLYANDSAGNSNSESSNFSVQVSGGNTGGSGGGGGGGSGGGSGGGGSRIANLARMSLSEVSRISLGRGESEIVSVEASNDGIRFLNRCGIEGSGDVERWISSRQIESLGPGELKEFVFNVNVPIDAQPGIYDSEISVVCNETSASTSFEIEVEAEGVEIIILSSERVGTSLVVNYALTDFTGEDQDVAVDYFLNSAEGITLVEGREVVFLEANQRQEYILEFELPRDSVGDFDLIFEVVIGDDINRAEGDVSLRGTGLAILDVSDANLRALSWVGGVLFVLLAFYMVFKFLHRHHKRARLHENKGRHFIKIKLDD